MYFAPQVLFISSFPAYLSYSFPITFHSQLNVITWNVRAFWSQRDANKVSISSTTVTRCFLTARDYVQTKRQYEVDPRLTKVGRRLGGHAKCRLPLLHASMRQRDASIHHLSIPRYICIPSFFSFMRQCDAAISRCEFGSAFPTRGIVCNDLWLRSVRTSQHHRYIHANSRPMLEANQDGTLPLPLPHESVWILISEPDHSLIFGVSRMLSTLLWL